MSIFDLFTNMLRPWQWALLAAIPPAIVALYFLKLRRQPLEVPSTYLWSKTIEDLHVNSIWQRLRQNLLLFLQLLLIALIILACLRPNWQGTTLSGSRFIFMVDNSASMLATDEEPSRLQVAKTKAKALVQEMKPGDVAMLVSFSDQARVEQPYTDNRRLLRQRIDSIQPTQRTSDLSSALRVAAGLANPGRSSFEAEQDVAAADAQPAQLFILTDGGFATIPNFAMGNLTPTYLPIGHVDAQNVGIMAFSASRHPERSDKMQAFARLHNFDAVDHQIEVSLYLDATLLDARELSLAKQSPAGVQFDFDAVDTGKLRLELQHTDHFDVDNVAYTALNTPQRARVLFCTPRNDALELAMSTDHILRIATTEQVTPAFLLEDEYVEQAASGAYDLVIYDQCRPTELPQANTLTIGQIPPGWAATEPQSVPQIIDVDQTHPLMHFVQMGDVTIAEATPVNVPPGGSVLIDSDVGAIVAIGPREAFEDAVVAFEIVGQNEDGTRYPNSDWPKRSSFPVFVKNALTYLGGGFEVEASVTVKPGESVELRAAADAEQLLVEAPGDREFSLGRGPRNEFLFGDTDLTGIYTARVPDVKEPTQLFAVNLFDSTESDIRPREQIRTEFDEVIAQRSWQVTRREAWKWLVVAGLCVLMLEWYIYNKRVYL